MSPHLAVAPFVLPIVTGAILLTLTDHPRARRAVAAVAGGLGLLVAGLLLMGASEGPISYQVGGWEWPFGIEVYVDRLSATMVALSALVGAVALLPALGYDDGRGRYFLALFFFQLAGINGSFLAGDLFNLFVCFEILLISSYALLVHGHARATRAGLAYTVLNLTGSALFLLGLGLIYGATGSLNLADVVSRLPALGPEVIAMGRAGAWILMLVFALKAAVLPLGLWLPGTYATAAPAVAALFALLTKVGIYAIIRVFGPSFADEASILGEMGAVLAAGAMISILLGAALALASRSLRHLAGALVIVSVATALLAVSVGGAASIAAALFYTLHSTLSAAALFLVAAALIRLRGAAEDRLESRVRLGADAPALLFLGIAVLVTGLPPLSGFLGKLGVLAVLVGEPSAFMTMGSLLVGSLVVLVAVSRAGSAIFFRAPERGEPPAPAAGVRSASMAAGATLALAVVLTVAAGPLRAWTDEAGAEALAPPSRGASIDPGGEP